MCRRRIHVAAVVATLALLPGLPALAQEGFSAGTMGRAGYQWQTQQDLARERLEGLLAELEELSLEEWKERTLAWIELDGLAEGEGTAIPASHRVASVEARRGTVQPLEESRGAWRIVYSRKPPKTLRLTMTDLDATEVKCPLRAALDEGARHLGVFFVDSVLHCFHR